MSDRARQRGAGKVRNVIEQLSAEERERLVRALAEAMKEELEERRRIESSRRLDK